MFKKHRLVRQQKTKINLLKISRKRHEIETRREELFKYYRDKCDRFVVYMSIKDGQKVEEEKSLEDVKRYFHHRSINDILPKELIKIRHSGILKILAFSDYRIHDINVLVNFVESLKPDLIIYAGDDVRRFSPAPLELVRAPVIEEDAPVEIEQVTLSSPENSGWISSSEYGLILRLPQDDYREDDIKKRVLLMSKLTNHVYGILKSSDIRFNRNQVTLFEELISKEFPFLVIREEEKEIKIIDTSIGTTVLSLMKLSSSKLVPWKGYWLLHRYRLDEKSFPKIKKIGEDGKYVYFYISINQPEGNIFEKLASKAKYGLAAVIGNDDDKIARAWIRGKKVYELHSTWLKIGSFLIIGLEGSTCGMGPSGKYLEGDVKVRLEIAQETLKSSDKLIIVSHTPPRGLLDRALRFGDEAIGSLALRDFIEECDKAALVICGHVHRCGGLQEKLGKTTIANVSSHDSPFDRANVAWILIDEDGNTNVRWIKLPSLIEQIFKNESKDQWAEALKERVFLSEAETELFIKMFEKLKDKLFDDLTELANLKFRYGFSWDNIFKLYMRGVKEPTQLTETVYKEILNNSSGIHKVHFMRGYIKIKRELEKEKIYLLSRIPLPSHNKVIIYDTEYSEVGVLYGFFDFSTKELKQFWFDEKEKAREYLKEKENYIFIHWGGADKKILKEELNCNGPTLNLLYYVQIFLVAPINFATLHDVHDALCGHKEDDWWEEYFYKMDGFDKLMLCNRILANPGDNNARKELMNANKADILALNYIVEKLKNL